MLLHLAWKNVISKKSSFVIILFVAFSIMLLVATNAVFDSTENGVEETFRNSFTGDVVVRPKNKNSLSLFGDETPVTGKLSKNPTLFPFKDVLGCVSSDSSVSAALPQLSGRTVLHTEDRNYVVYVFGVQASEYLSSMSSIIMEEGGAWASGAKGAMITRDYADKLGVSLGDQIEFVVDAGLSSRVRAVPVTGIYHYSVENSVMEKIVLVNPETVRSLFDISDMASSDSVQLSDEKEEFLDDFADLDDMFGDASDLSETVVEDVVSVSSEEVEAIMKSYSESTSWNFLVCKLHDSKETNSTIKRLNRTFKEKGWDVEAVGWRSSAGSTAFYLFILRLILNFGIMIILFAGFIVINNTLVINVLDRIREIGTMRAIGANKRYISVECMAETLMMAITAGVLGCVLGSVLSVCVSAAEISIGNSFLVQLFGGEKLVTQLKFSNLFWSFLLSVFIGLVAWVYPVVTALKIRPVQAMQGAK
nr:ABC transporter permease [Treponema sp.]